MKSKNSLGVSLAVELTIGEELLFIGIILIGTDGRMVEVGLIHGMFVYRSKLGIHILIFAVIIRVSTIILYEMIANSFLWNDMRCTDNEFHRGGGFLFVR